MLVDTMGNRLRVVIHRASIADRAGAYVVLEDVTQHSPALHMIWAAQGYTGELRKVLQQHEGITLQIVATLADQQGGAAAPRGGRTDMCLAGPLPALKQGVRRAA